jgi:hypothetical protein
MRLVDEALRDEQHFRRVENHRQILSEDDSLAVRVLKMILF